MGTELAGKQEEAGLPSAPFSRVSWLHCPPDCCLCREPQIYVWSSATPKPRPLMHLHRTVPTPIAPIPHLGRVHHPVPRPTCTSHLCLLELFHLWLQTLALESWRSVHLLPSLNPLIQSQSHYRSASRSALLPCPYFCLLHGHPSARTLQEPLFPNLVDSRLQTSAPLSPYFPKYNLAAVSYKLTDLEGQAETEGSSLGMGQ